MENLKPFIRDALLIYYQSIAEYRLVSEDRVDPLDESGEATMASNRFLNAIIGCYVRLMLKMDNEALIEQLESMATDAYHCKFRMGLKEQELAGRLLEKIDNL